MGVRDMGQFLERWEMDVPGVRRRMILAPVPRERERWYARWLLTQGWTAQATAEALERDPHTIGRWLAAFGAGPARSSKTWAAEKRSNPPTDGVWTGTSTAHGGFSSVLWEIPPS